MKYLISCGGENPLVLDEVCCTEHVQTPHIDIVHYLKKNYDVSFRSIPLLYLINIIILIFNINKLEKNTPSPALPRGL